MIEKIEEFHLTFLEFFSKTTKQDLYAIKGGCNLRFFFKSIRYSEDLDLDFKTIALDTLRKKVDKILISRPFQNSLLTRDLNIRQFSSPKQTNTTQRWKITLESSNNGLVLNTKIEFSRRGMEKDIVFESVHPLLLEKYRFPPIFLSHYPPSSAISQKYLALEKRAETQARDIFDIFYLLERNETKHFQVKVDIEKIKGNIQSMDFNIFKSQVVSYLEPEYQDIYNSPDKWEEIRKKVSESLEKWN